MNVLTTEHKNLSSNPTKNDRAVTTSLFPLNLTIDTITRLHFYSKQVLPKTLYNFRLIATVYQAYSKDFLISPTYMMGHKSCTTELLVCEVW